jgi:outer membrane receptor protein involved in Fe transport
MPSRIFFDVLGTFTVAETFKFYAGVDNLLNQDPPPFPGANGSGNNVLFNPVGRTFKAGVRVTY